MSEARARGRSVRDVGIEPVRSVDLRPVDQTVADRGPLDGGLRTVEFGLQMPSGYRQVFARSGGGFMRADGGLVATFPQSIYVATQQGVLPDIPASTVFVIGGVPMGAEPGHGRILPLNPLDLGQGPAAPDDRVIAGSFRGVKVWLDGACERTRENARSRTRKSTRAVARVRVCQKPNFEHKFSFIEFSLSYYERIFSGLLFFRSGRKASEKTKKRNEPWENYAAFRAQLPLSQY